MPAIVIIPARYASTRFPGKPLCPLFNRPLIQHVYERAVKAKRVRRVLVATDDERIIRTVEGFGGEAIMTSPDHPSGTDRIAETLLTLQESGYEVQDADVVVNVQGDEPMIAPEMVDEVIGVMDDERASLGTLMKRITEEGDITNPNVVKVVRNAEGFALYFSRAPIPFHREERDGGLASASSFFFKHIGIYAYRKDALLRLSKLPPSRLEGIEKLEQLRALENGLPIKVAETSFETIGVDTPEDLERVEKCLSTSL
ncbi:MAG: 3-deoxy-manno-octulosonate cytidylyltransferase [Nitrospirales bacterium]|nr:3-deoxy-manno-octulosonate cytidylyltransferase [Nitrospirales bacterium]